MFTSLFVRKRCTVILYCIIRTILYDVFMSVSKCSILFRSCIVFSCTRTYVSYVTCEQYEFPTWTIKFELNWIELKIMWNLVEIVKKKLRLQMCCRVKYWKLSEKKSCDAVMFPLAASVAKWRKLSGIWRKPSDIWRKPSGIWRKIVAIRCRLARATVNLARTILLFGA